MKKEMTPEEIKGAFKKREEENKHILFKKLNRIVDRFNRRYIAPSLLKNGSCTLKNRQLKKVQLKLDSTEEGKPYASTESLYIALDTLRWGTPPEMKDVFIAKLRTYTSAYHVLAKSGKDGKFICISIFPKN